MNASSSGVAFSAAKIRSPSFSRSSSPTTTTARPLAMSAIARSIASKSVICWSPYVRHGQPFHVLGEHIDLEVDDVARLAETQGGQFQGRGYERDRELLRERVDHGQRDAVHRYRAFFHEV